MATWNEKLSDQLRDLNKIRNPNAGQLKRIKELKAIKAGGATTSNPIDKGTEGLGDTATNIDSFLDGIFGNLGPLDLSGAPKILGATDLASEGQAVYDASYGEATKNVERDRKQALMDKKQELANRGIPFSANENDLWTKATGGVDERFDALKTSAANNARLAKEDSIAKAQGISKTAHDAFVNEALAGYQSKLDAATTGAGVLQTLMQKYNIDQATAQEILNRKSAEKIAREANAARNRVSGGGGGGDTGGGFEIV